MIRQAISCDICGSEKQQTNHWFVAYECNGELRLAAWEGPKTRRPTVKHLCGQKCVHRLLDDFMAGHPAVAANDAPTLVSAPKRVAGQAQTEQHAIPTPPAAPETAAFAHPAASTADRSLTSPDLEAARLAETKLRNMAWERERALLERAHERSSKRPATFR